MKLIQMYQVSNHSEREGLGHIFSRCPQCDPQRKYPWSLHSVNKECSDMTAITSNLTNSKKIIKKIFSIFRQMLLI